MRNWNWSFFFLFRAGRSVYSLPMRNWNAVFSIPLLYAKVIAYLWGIETTISIYNFSLAYLVYSLPMRNWNDQMKGDLVGLLRVYSLPMRNWNKVGYINWSKKVMFIAYLWGIETILSTLILKNIRKFIAYLWGIETWGPWFLLELLF